MLSPVTNMKVINNEAGLFHFIAPSLKINKTK